jgi:hypothetical protein
LEKNISTDWPHWGFGTWNKSLPITRIQFAKLLDYTINPFDRFPVNHEGFIKSP